MSTQIVMAADIPGDALRDFSHTFADNATFTIDMVQEFRAVGMDAFIHNMAATVIEISFDGGVNITVGAGAIFIRNNSRYALLTVTAVAEAFELVVDGMLITTCKRRNWL